MPSLKYSFNMEPGNFTKEDIKDPENEGLTDGLLFGSIIYQGDDVHVTVYGFEGDGTDLVPMRDTAKAHMAFTIVDGLTESSELPPAIRDIYKVFVNDVKLAIAAGQQEGGEELQ